MAFIHAALPRMLYLGPRGRNLDRAETHAVEGQEESTVGFTLHCLPPSLLPSSPSRYKILTSRLAVTTSGERRGRGVTAATAAAAGARVRPRRPIKVGSVATQSRD